MSAYKQLSEYFSDDQRKRASIRKELDTGSYVVHLVNDAGSAFSAIFETEEQAEQYCEDWVS